MLELLLQLRPDLHWGRTPLPASKCSSDCAPPSTSTWHKTISIVFDKVFSIVLRLLESAEPVGAPKRPANAAFELLPSRQLRTASRFADHLTVFS
jgi:hypothetical protein